MAVADGTRLVVATPHVHMVEVRELPERVSELRARLGEAGVELQVCGGGELSPIHVEHISDGDLELLAHGPPDDRWVLLEAPLEPTATDFATAAAEIRNRGYGLLVGHPERSPFTSREAIVEQVRDGAVLQINASSVIGGHGARAQRGAFDLARSGLPIVLASDAHSALRPPGLTQAGAALARAGIAAAVIEWAVDTGPGLLLSDGLAAGAHFR
jgi:protein-tyrosine phosphatase